VQLPGQQFPGQQAPGQQLPIQQFPGQQAPGQPDANQPFPVQPGAPGQFVPGNPNGPLPGQPGFNPQNFNPAPNNSDANTQFVPPQQTQTTSQFNPQPGNFAPQPGNFAPRPGNFAPQPISQPAGSAPNGQAATPNAALNMINDLLRTPRQAPNAPAAANPMNAGGLAGVASTYSGPSIKTYRERSKYEEWEFIFDLKQGLPGQPAPNQPQPQASPNANSPAQPGAPSQPQPQR
jgi:hypothetical protein